MDSRCACSHEYGDYKQQNRNRQRRKRWNSHEHNETKIDQTEICDIDQTDRNQVVPAVEEGLLYEKSFHAE